MSNFPLWVLTTEADRVRRNRGSIRRTRSTSRQSSARRRTSQPPAMKDRHECAQPRWRNANGRECHDEHLQHAHRDNAREALAPIVTQDGREGGDHQDGCDAPRDRSAGRSANTGGDAPSIAESGRCRAKTGSAFEELSRSLRSGPQDPPYRLQN